MCTVLCICLPKWPGEGSMMLLTVSVIELAKRLWPGVRKWYNNRRWDDWKHLMHLCIKCRNLNAHTAAWLTYCQIFSLCNILIENILHFFVFLKDIFMHAQTHWSILNYFCQQSKLFSLSSRSLKWYINIIMWGKPCVNNHTWMSEARYMYNFITASNLLCFYCIEICRFSLRWVWDTNTLNCVT